MVRADQPVIAYCGGGISATVDLFALWLTGRDDARLYDGSLTWEWSANPRTFLSSPADADEGGDGPGSAGLRPDSGAGSS